MLGQEWVDSPSWVHSELAGSSEAQWPALPAKPLPSGGQTKGMLQCGGPSPSPPPTPGDACLAMPEEGALTAEFLSGSQSGFVGGQRKCSWNLIPPIFNALQKAP